MKKLDCSAIAVGARIGRLTIDAVERSSNGFKVITTCDCGNSFVTPRSLLLFGVQSCGCLFADRAEMNERIRRGQPPQGRYNGLASRNPAEYGIWLKMLQRCCDPQSVGYHNYGGRGITVCQRWQESFAAFFTDMGKRPLGRSIERRCNDQGYSPDNCYWATRAEQSRNTRRNRRITFDGRTLIITDWAKEIGIHHASLRLRLKTWPLEKALTAPPRRLDPRLGRRHRPTRSAAGR